MAKILLVEDEINIASFIERGLKEFGHTVTVCHDGNAGWKILQDEPFDLLILDIIMPKINYTYPRICQSSSRGESGRYNYQNISDFNKGDSKLCR